MKLVSIIMAVYNSEKHIKETIDSILEQTHSHFELIIVDDCSEDSSLELVKSYNDFRIRIIQNNENIGLPNSLNKAISETKGFYIARMDSDDICFPNRIERQIEYLEKHNLDIVGTSIICFSNNRESFKQTYPENSSVIKDFLKFGNPFAHPSILCKSEILKANPYSDILSEDLYLWSQLREQKISWSNINEPLLKYRLHASNISKNRAAQKCARIIYLLNYKGEHHLLNDLPGYKLHLNEFIVKVMQRELQLDRWEKMYLLMEEKIFQNILTQIFEGKFSIHRTTALYERSLELYKSGFYFKSLVLIFISFFSDPINFLFHIALLRRNYLVIKFIIRCKKVFQ